MTWETMHLNAKDFVRHVSEVRAADVGLSIVPVCVASAALIAAVSALTYCLWPVGEMIKGVMG